MFLSQSPLARTVLAGLLILAGLVILPAAPAGAETSYHKLKKRLHKAERRAGDVIQKADDEFLERSGEAACEDDDATVSLDVSIGGKTGQKHTEPVKSSKPAAKPHLAK